MIVSRKIRRVIKSAMKSNGVKSPADQLSVVRSLVNMGMAGPYSG